MYLYTLVMKTVISSEDKTRLDFKELKSYGGLFKNLSLRDVMVRYKQTWIGFGWSIFRPLINIIIFSGLALLVDKSKSAGEQFITVSAGVIFWQLISTAIADVSNALSNNTNLLTKVYFPKLLLPLSSILVCIIDFAISFSLFLILFFVFKGLPTWTFLFMPLVLIYGLLFAFGFGLFFATSSVKYRDVKFILPFLLQLLFYVTPVFISTTYFMNLAIPEFIKTIYQINPLVQIINAFKWCLFGSFEGFQLNYFLISIAITLLTLWGSVRYFLKVENTFADFI